MNSSERAPVGGKEGNALIVDKEGTLGEAIAQRLSQIVSTVFVSQKKPQPDSSIIHISFSETIPTIPDDTYVTLIYVFNESNKELVEPLKKKAEEDNIPFFIVVAHEQLPLLFEQNTYGQVIVVGELFGTPEKTTQLDIWLAEVKKTKKIVLPNMGLATLYPVLFSDAVAVISDTCLQPHKRIKDVYRVTPAHPVTFISLSHALQKIDPALRIDFRGEAMQSAEALPEGETLLHDYAPLEKIKEYYKQILVKEDPEHGQFSFFAPPVSKKKQQKKKIAPILFVFYTLLIFVLMPVALMLVSGVTGKWLLLSGVEDTKKGEFSPALQKFAAAKTDLAFSQFSLDLVTRELSLIGQASRLKKVQQQVALGRMVSESFLEGVTAVQKIQGVIIGTSLKPTEDVKDGANGVRNTLVMVQKLQTYDIPKEYKETWSLVTAYLPLIETIGGALPQLIGAEGERKYLVLFQNNTELRPGGGFIGSYGILTLSRGKFKGFTVHDVYDADGQLQGHVEPPFAIRRYMPLVHLYLRDSNFDVDFVKNAQKALFMLHAETGETVNGVIGVDLSFVQKVIGAMGKVFVASTNDTVTADNFFLLTEQRAEKNFFAGSTQKKDFLSALFTALQEKLLSANGVSHQKLFEAILQGIEEKHLLLASSDPSLQTVLSVNGLSSALLDTREDDKTVLNDFVGVNEANIGIDKVNYFVKREITQDIHITDKGQIKESLTLTLHNTSTGEWPGGDYKNYLRFILPKGAHVDAVWIDGKEQKIVNAITDPKVYEAKYFIAPQGLEVEQSEESGKSIVGFLVTVPVKKTTTITLSYTLATVVDLSQPLSTYSLQVFKQPGIDVLPYALNLTYPQGFSLLKSDQSEDTTGQVSWEKDVRKDTLLTLPFAKK